MKPFLLMLRQGFAFRAFLIRRLARYTLAEFFFLCAERLPAGDTLWNWTLRLNPHHIPAALGRAQFLTQARDLRAGEAFQAAQRIIENPQGISASDLALTLVPGRLAQRLARQDAMAQETKRKQLFQALAGETVTPPAVPEVPPPPRLPRAAWAGIEALWTPRKMEQALALAEPFILRGEFTSPLDTLVWAQRFLSDAVGLPAAAASPLERNRNALAAKCVAWAQQWLPERALTWTLSAQVAQHEGALERAKLYLERAASLRPDDLAIFLARQNLTRPTALREAPDARLRVIAPPTLGLGAVTELECTIENSAAPFQLYVLASAGYGIVPTRLPQTIVPQQPARVEIRACRPDRINGQAWALTVVAICADEYVSAQVSIAVPDTQRGQLLVVVTEDHELWEERGTLPRADIQRLLVEKSEFAASHFAPWTHMVEVGTTLALPEWAAASATTRQAKAEWSETRDAVRAHLQAEIERGNDIQPHLHAFNLPTAPAFPFHLAASGIEPTTEFLLTAEEHRRDFARAYPPQERIAVVAAAAAQLETLAHRADPNYRAVLWRSGQLEFGDDVADRAWSGVALLRAGLFADSDLPKATFPWRTLPRTAFFAALDDPYTPAHGGELLQLPVTANLEGDFLSDTQTLQTIAAQTGEALQDVPGVHVVTLLTHDKFINARRGADEFLLDAAYNEWVTIRKHLAAWDAAGAKRVTARQAVQTLLDDGAWRLTAWLQNETWLTANCVRYTVMLLGKNISVSDVFPQWVLVTLPPFLRERIMDVSVFQNEQPIELDKPNANHFWFRLTRCEPAPYCELTLQAWGDTVQPSQMWEQPQAAAACL